MDELSERSLLALQHGFNPVSRTILKTPILLWNRLDYRLYGRNREAGATKITYSQLSQPPSKLILTLVCNNLFLPCESVSSEQLRRNRCVFAFLLGCVLHYRELRFFVVILKSEDSTILRNLDPEAEFGESSGRRQSSSSCAATFDV